MVYQRAFAYVMKAEVLHGGRLSASPAERPSSAVGDLILRAALLRKSAGVTSELELVF
jgi:hypothetical protein